MSSAAELVVETRTITFKDLDFVLSYIDNINRSFKTLSVDEYKANLLLDGVSLTDHMNILKKLKIDKMIYLEFPDNEQPYPDFENIIVSFEGVLLLQEGGYIGRFGKENSEKRLNKTIAVLVMIGTVGAMVFSGISLYISSKTNNNKRAIIIQIPMKDSSFSIRK